MAVCSSKQRHWIGHRNVENEPTIVCLTEKRELLQSLEMYYKVFFLGETIEDDGEMIGKES